MKFGWDDQFNVARQGRVYPPPSPDTEWSPWRDPGALVVALWPIVLLGLILYGIVASGGNLGSSEPVPGPGPGSYDVEFSPRGPAAGN